MSLSVGHYMWHFKMEMATFLLSPMRKRRKKSKSGLFINRKFFVSQSFFPPNSYSKIRLTCSHFLPILFLSHSLISQIQHRIQFTHTHTSNWVQWIHCTLMNGVCKFCFFFFQCYSDWFFFPETIRMCALYWPIECTLLATLNRIKKAENINTYLCAHSGNLFFFFCKIKGKKKQQHETNQMQFVWLFCVLGNELYWKLIDSYKTES